MVYLVEVKNEEGTFYIVKGNSSKNHLNIREFGVNMEVRVLDNFDVGHIPAQTYTAKQLIEAIKEKDKYYDSKIKDNRKKLAAMTKRKNDEFDGFKKNKEELQRLENIIKEETSDKE